MRSVGWFLLGVGAVNVASWARYPEGSTYDAQHAQDRRTGIALGALGLYILTR